MSDLFLVTPITRSRSAVFFNCPSFNRKHTTCHCLLSPHPHPLPPSFRPSLPHCLHIQPTPVTTITTASPALPYRALSFHSSPLSQPFLTSLGPEICLPILIPLRQEFWIFITPIHPFFFGDGLEKGGHLLIARTLLGFDNTFPSR